MRLDLHTLIDMPGTSIPFSYEPDISGFEFDSVKEISGITAAGEVRNEAGVIVLDGGLSLDLTCICARCLKEFSKHIDLDVDATIAEEIQDESNEDIFLLDGDFADLDEIFITALVLNMEQRFLCREDCKGLCSRCGKDLNDGPCGCEAERDPRLAVLGQLLEKE